MTKRVHGKRASLSANPKVGDEVAHDGTWPGHYDEYGPYLVVEVIADRGLLAFANARYKAICSIAELQRCTVKGITAWHLEGRFFSAEQRKAARVVLDLDANAALPPDDELMETLTSGKQLGLVDDLANGMFAAAERRHGAKRVEELKTAGYTQEQIVAAAEELVIDVLTLHAKEQRQILELLKKGA